MLKAKPMNKDGFNHFNDDCAKGIFVENVLLTNFRNYQSLKLDMSLDKPSPVVLFGQNGAGKTNLLEALSYLTSGRGIRGAKLADVASNSGDGSWAVSANVNGHTGPIKIGTGIVNSSDLGLGEAKQTDRRVVRLDGEPASGPAALAELLSMVWLTPKMDRLFLEGSSARRKFFDQFVQGLHPDHSRHLGAYERTMRERLAVLCDKERQADPSWVQALEKRMAEHGVALAAARNETLAHLTGQIASQTDGAFPKARLSLDGLLENMLESQFALEVEDNFANELAQTRGLDRATGRTNVGPHKTDMVVHHVKKDMPAKQCSTGEQKALLIGIVLADVRLQRSLCGQAPILLLDEISAHLDENRRANLFGELMDLNCQAWLTGTDYGLFASLEGKAKFLSINNGSIDV